MLNGASSVARSVTPFTGRNTAAGATLLPPSASHVTLNKVSTLRLKDDVLFAHPFAAGNIGAVLLVGAQWLHAVATDGDAFSSMGAAGSAFQATSDLPGDITCVHTIPLHGCLAAQGTNKSLAVIGTSCGHLRIFVVQFQASALGFVVQQVATVSLSAVSSQFGACDVVESLAIVQGVNQVPESVVAASRQCVVAVSLKAVATALAPGGCLPSLHALWTRLHCSVHSDCPIVKVLSVPQNNAASATQKRAGLVSSSNSIADHCAAALVVFQNGCVRYMVRCALGGAQEGTTEYAYRLSGTCSAVPDSNCAAHVVINDAEVYYNDLQNALDVVFSGVEMMSPDGAVGSAASSALGGASAASFAMPQSSSSQYFTPLSTTMSPYSCKTPWWGCLMNAVPLSSSQIVLPNTVGLPSLVLDERYTETVDAVVAQWARDAYAVSSAAPARGSTTVPSDRRGLSTCTVVAGHVVVCSMGSELHLTHLSKSAALGGSVEGSSNRSLPGTQSAFAFASPVTSCRALVVGCGGWASTTHPLIVVSSGSSVHLLAVGGSASRVV